MQELTTTSQSLKSNSPPKPSSALALNANSESKRQLDAYLLGCFSAQRLYGRDPGSLESVSGVFHAVLAKYPADQVLRAMELWIERSAEFPTPADIVGLIRRGGKPPLAKEVYIALSKKHPEDRTDSDWRYLREYEAEQTQAEWGSEATHHHQEENFRLRKRVNELEGEVSRLGEMLHQSRVQKRIERPKPTVEQKVAITVATMGAGGASQAEIDEFLRPYGVLGDAMAASSQGVS